MMIWEIDQIKIIIKVYKSMETASLQLMQNKRK